MGDYRRDREKYRLFCGFLHIKTAAWIMFALGVISLLWQVFRSNYHGTRFGNFAFMHSIDFTEVMLMTFALTMLLCGLIAERQSFLVPYLVVQAIKVIGYGLFIVMYILDKFFHVLDDDEKPKTKIHQKNGTLTASEEVEEEEFDDWIKENPGWFFGTVLGINCIFFVIALIALYVIVKCRKYFFDLDSHNQRQSSSVYAASSNYQAPYTTY